MLNYIINKNNKYIQILADRLVTQGQIENINDKLSSVKL